MQAEPYPFLIARVSDDAYAELASELYGATGSGKLCWLHGAV